MHCVGRMIFHAVFGEWTGAGELGGGDGQGKNEYRLALPGGKGESGGNMSGGHCTWRHPPIHTNQTAAT